MFTVDLGHAKALTEEFHKHGYKNAHYISSEMDSKECARLIQGFRDGEIPIIINCGILTEGVGTKTIFFFIFPHIDPAAVSFHVSYSLA